MKNRTIISFLLVLFLGCFSCCSFQSNYDNHISFDWGSDALGTRYLIDTISIEGPRICVCGDELYILPNKCIDSFSVRPQSNEIAKIFKLLPHNVRIDLFDAEPSNNSEFTERAMVHLSMSGVYGLYNRRSFADMTYFEKTIGDIDIYTFKKQPIKFVLELFWYDPKRYIDNPYGPNYYAITRKQTGSTNYSSKIDSLESCPICPNATEPPHYVLTVEPLFTRDSINRHIEEEEGFVKNGPFVKRPWHFSRSFAKKYAFPDL